MCGDVIEADDIAILYLSRFNIIPGQRAGGGLRVDFRQGLILQDPDIVFVLWG